MYKPLLEALKVGLKVISIVGKTLQQIQLQAEETYSGLQEGEA